MNVLISSVTLDIAKKNSLSHQNAFIFRWFELQSEDQFKSLKPKLIATLTGSNEDQP